MHIVRSTWEANYSRIEAIGWANVVGILFFVRFSVETVASSPIAAIAKHDIFVTYIIRGIMVLAYKE